MTEIQEKAVKIALRSYGNGCMSDEEFIDILNAILCRVEPNNFFNTPGILPRDITNPITYPRPGDVRPGDVWVTHTNNEISNTSINKNAKDINISDYPKYTKQSTFKD